MSKAPLEWRRQVSPRYAFVARGEDGYFEIIEKGWFYAFIADSLHDDTIQWQKASSFDDAKRLCEQIETSRIPKPQKNSTPPTGTQRTPVIC
jgi:hypothetical protein